MRFLADMGVSQRDRAMPRTLALDAAKGSLRELIEGLVPGEELVLTPHDEPLAIVTRPPRTSWPCQPGYRNPLEMPIHESGLVQLIPRGQQQFSPTYLRSISLVTRMGNFSFAGVRWSVTGSTSKFV